MRDRLISSISKNLAINYNRINELKTIIVFHWL